MRRDMTLEWNQNIPSTERVKKRKTWPYHSLHEWQKKKCTSLCSPQSISQHCWCQFSKCSANKILHPLYLWGLRILWSLTTRFTSLLRYSLKKLYKHSYTIEMEVLCNGHPSCYGPNVTIFTALNLNTFTPQPCTQANAKLYRYHNLDCFAAALHFRTDLRLIRKTIDRCDAEIWRSYIVKNSLCHHFPTITWFSAKWTPQKSLFIIIKVHP